MQTETVFSVDSPTGEGDNEGPSADDMEGQWFSVVEPMTRDILVDTIIAQLGTLTTLCSILSTLNSSPSTSLALIEDYSSKLIKNKLPVLLQDADAERLQEVALARANFVSELLKAGYLMNSIDAELYKRERDAAFQVPELGLESSFPALLANANSLIAFNAALAERNTSTTASGAVTRWTVLTAAISTMAAASKLSDSLPDEIAETHYMRGNCSLLLHQLGKPPVSHSPAVANGLQLLKNAGTFYRNASKLYRSSEQEVTSQLRASVVQALQAGTSVSPSAVQHVQGRGRDWVKAQLDDMVDDGLLSPLP